MLPVVRDQRATLDYVALVSEMPVKIGGHKTFPIQESSKDSNLAVNHAGSQFCNYKPLS